MPPEVGRSVVKCSRISRNIHFLPTKEDREEYSKSFTFVVLILLKIAVLGTSKNNGFKGQLTISIGAENGKNKWDYQHEVEHKTFI